MKEAEHISSALLSGTLRLGSAKTGATMPMRTLYNRPMVSKDWGFDLSFDEICKKSLYCFRIRSKSRDDNKPHFAVSETKNHIEFVQISNDNYGITVSATGSMPKSKLNNNNLEISKDGNQMTVYYLIETGSGDLVI